MAKRKKNICLDIFDKQVNAKYILLVYVIFAIVFMITTILVSGRNDYSIDDLFDNNNVKLKDDIKSIINDQNKSINKLLSASKNDVYTLDDPYILINPFVINELSAILVFNTDIETSVSVGVNDKYLGKTESSFVHIIPVYDLYEGANNRVELSLDNGYSKTIIIKTKSLDYSLDEEYSNLYDHNNILFNSLVGDDFSYIRGFDFVGNLKLNISGLKYIKGYSIIDNNLVVNYGRDDNYINITMDYLGRIISIEDNGEKYSLDDKEINIYSDKIYNYTLKLFSRKTNVSSFVNLNFDDVANYLVEAQTYKDGFNAMIVDKKLYYQIDKSGYLILVRSDGQIESYLIDDNKIININDNYSYSLYLLSNDTYYNLITTI